MASVAIATLTRYPDIFERFVRSVSTFEPSVTGKYFVCSGGAYPTFAHSWIGGAGPEPFKFATNANIALRAAFDARYDYILLSNDDVELTGPTLDNLAELARSPDVGIISPAVIGGINNETCRMPNHRLSLQETAEYIPFVCVLIPRRTLVKIGYLDERFTGYGGEDVDYCRRIQAAGLKLCVASRIWVRHGFGEHTYSSSFLRQMSQKERTESMAGTSRQLAEKYAK